MDKATLNFINNNVTHRKRLIRIKRAFIFSLLISCVLTTVHIFESKLNSKDVLVSYLLHVCALIAFLSIIWIAQEWFIFKNNGLSAFLFGASLVFGYFLFMEILFYTWSKKIEINISFLISFLLLSFCAGIYQWYKWRPNKDRLEHELFAK